MSADHSDPLFERRTPEAAARQLATVLAQATEYQLATLELYRARNRTSRRDMERHRRIADELVFHCHDLGVEPRGLRGRLCTRLDERLKSMKEEQR